MPTASPSVLSPFASFKPYHLGLRVPDFEAAIAWYTETLDFRLVHSWPVGDKTFGFLAAPMDDSFSLEVIGGPGANSRSSQENLADTLKIQGWHHLCFQVASVDDTIAELKRRGVTIVSEPRDVPEIRSRFAFFADPWNNLLEVIQPINI